MNRFSRWRISSPLRPFLVATILVIVIVISLDFFILDSSELPNILVEAHGLLLDLVVFGIILKFYEIATSKRQRIDRYLEELDDYRGWDEPEAAYRVAGLVSRLKKEGIENVDYKDLNVSRFPKEVIEELVLKGTKLRILKRANLRLANLKGADFEEANLEDSDLSGANLEGANLFFANLRGAKLFGAKLRGAMLFGANFDGTILIAAHLEGADLIGANLEGAFVQKNDWDHWRAAGYDFTAGYFLSESSPQGICIIQNKPTKGN